MIEHQILQSHIHTCNKHKEMIEFCGQWEKLTPKLLKVVG